MTVDVNALVEIQISIRPTLDAMKNVVCILGAKAAEQHFVGFSFAVLIAIMNEPQLGGICHVSATVLRPDASRNEKPLIENGALVGLAVFIGVLEHENLIVLCLPRPDLRVNGTASHPQSTACIPGHLNWLVNHRF